MASILEEICNVKRKHVESNKADFSLDLLKSKLPHVDKAEPFLAAMQSKADNNDIALIAEIKKASPSKGVIRHDFDPEAIARAYQRGGATCLSVLTDMPYFKGRDRYIGLAKENCTLPILRKDFIVDPYQVYESRLLGADCILLIMAALDAQLAKDLYNLAKDLSMDIIVETHDEEDMEKAITLNADMIGINSRNLKTMDVSLDNAIALVTQIPSDCFPIAESGIYSFDDIKRLQSAGFKGFLVGESLMRQKDITQATLQLLGKA